MAYVYRSGSLGLNETEDNTTLPAPAPVTTEVQSDASKVLTIIGLLGLVSGVPAIAGYHYGGKRGALTAAALTPLIVGFAAYGIARA